MSARFFVKSQGREDHPGPKPDASKPEQQSVWVSDKPYRFSAQVGGEGVTKKNDTTRRGPVVPIVAMASAGINFRT